ncbi:hypothetical protein [Nitrosomonas marina]|uniref:Uncharacterized protein n=1 Tax=Nitrosomonas marina TaxID=917 RepID=A0A1H8GRX0_9PROT|nr:hypothetical protein [Nitrosomonas marina]SEN46595.1 hypothetical protein SAMN05216325_11941 [Nitrosomonas marina]
MFCYIKEWPNKMASLITADGIVLCTCQNTDEAQQIWRDWKQQHLKSTTSAATETEIEIQSYSPTVADWLKTVVAGFYARTEKKVVNG